MPAFGEQHRKRASWKRAVAAGAVVLGCAPWLWSQSQVFIVQQEKIAGIPEFKPTAVELSKQHLNTRTRQELIRVLDSEQGFARRPLPLGSHGLVLHANGDMTPNGSDYVEELQRDGISAKPGDRVVISDIRIEGSRMVFEFNGGPDKKHKFLRHISIGSNPAYSTPVIADDGQNPVGSRLTLTFDGFVPEMTGNEVKMLIQPVIDFDVKSPVEAYTDTLPNKLKNAILNHQVLVGMDRKMVVYALGQPQQKVREQNGNGQFEEWIYGEPPKPTQFVRFMNSRVVRLEIAEVGEAPVIRDHDETDGYLNNPMQHDVYLGDARAPNADGERTAKAPSLRLPGEALPNNPMQPVQMPKNGTDKPQVQPIPPPPGPETGSGPSQYLSLNAPAPPVR